MSGSEFVLNCVDSLYYKLHKISVNRSYKDSPKWLKNKKATINPGNNNAKRFQYAITVALKVNQREYQTLNPLLINMIGKEYIFHQVKKIGLSLK